MCIAATSLGYRAARELPSQIMHAHIKHTVVSPSSAPYSIIDTVMTGVVIIICIQHGCTLALRSTGKLLHNLDQVDAGMQITPTRGSR